MPLLQLLLQISASIIVLTLAFILKTSTDLLLVRINVAPPFKRSFAVRFAGWLYLFAPALLLVMLIFTKSPFIGLINE